ncbi:MAG TPA: hypothetical protein VEX18_00310 [Polyangiaceae bacterium]|nr:hypothetical protein [Polyangiaceae bacterium]
MVIRLARERVKPVLASTARRLGLLVSNARAYAAEQLAHGGTCVARAGACRSR